MNREQNTSNRFRLGMRGNIKSNSQIDSFLKSQEVFKLVQNTLGSPSIPRESTSFRIPRKHSPPRDTSTGRSTFKNAHKERNSRNGNSRNRNSRNRNSRDRNSFKGQGAMIGTSRKNARRNDQKLSHRELLSRRERDNHSSHYGRPCNKQSYSSFSSHSRKRSRDDSNSRSGFENSRPKLSTSNEVMDQRNTAWRDYEKPESKHQSLSHRIQNQDQLDYPDLRFRNCFQYKGDTDCRDASRGNNSYSNIYSQHVGKSFSTERHLDNQFLDVPGEMSHERYSSSEKFACDKDLRYSPDDRSRQEHHGGNNPYSNIHSRQVQKSSSPERRLDNPFLEAFDQRSREHYSSSEKFACDKDLRYSPKDHNREEPCESSRGQTEWNDETNSVHSQQQESDYESERLDKAAANREKNRKKNQRKLMRTLNKKADKSLIGKPCQFEIKDQSDPKGKIAEHNVPALVKSISNIVEETALMNPLNPNMTYPRYLGHYYRDDKLFVVCGDFSSRDFLLRRLEKVPPPWSGASLKCCDIPHKECLVDVKIPKSIRHISQFRTICEENNKGLDTKSWRLIGYEEIEGEDRLLYTIGMAKESLDAIQYELRGRIRCGDEYIDIALNEANT